MAPTTSDASTLRIDPETLTTQPDDEAALRFTPNMEIAVDRGETFRPVGGGPRGSGMALGIVYTEDFKALYARTASYAFTSTPLYIAVYFFAADDTALGMFQCGAAGVVAGASSGKGSWS